MTNNPHRTRAVLAAGLTGLALLLLATSSMGTDPPYDWRLHWSTLETEHFDIHFHEGEEDLAAEIAGIAEAVHPEISARYGWTPKRRTQVVLVDNMDEANAMATPIPYNAIYIRVTAPGGHSPLDDYDHWLRTLFIHEYTHIIQLDMAGGFMGLLRHIFGRIIIPNGLQPQWMIEGLAVLEETRGTAAGRGRSAWTDMLLRAAVLEDRFPAIDQAGGGLVSWPGHNVPYLFGADFHRFVTERYGKGTWAEIAKGYSRFPVPFFVNHNARKVLDKSFIDLWEEWHEELKQKYEEQVRRIRAEPTTRTTPLTEAGGLLLSPRFSPDGKSILYTESLDDEFPAVKLTRLDGSSEVTVLKNQSAGDFAWHPDGKWAVCAAFKKTNNNYRSYYRFYDLYKIDLEKRQSTRITRSARAREPDLAPDGHSVVCVRNSLDQTNLWIYDLESREFRAVTSSADGTQYAEPRWSPDGELIAASVKPPGGRREIVVYDPGGEERLRVPAGRGHQRSPCWGPDGSCIYFSSDRTGLYNIYSFCLDGAEVRRVTNVISGAFEPDISPDGETIVFLSYGARGFDLHLAPACQGTTVEADPAGDIQTAPPATEIDEIDQTQRPYNPLPTLFPPRYLMPGFSFNTEEAIFGLTTGGSDPLREHNYWAGATYYTGSRHVGWSVGYTNKQLAPWITLSAYDYSVPYGEIVYDDRGNLRDYYEERLTASATISHVIKKVSISLGYSVQDRRSITDFASILFGSPDVGYYSMDDFSGIFHLHGRELDSLSQVLDVLPDDWNVYQITVPDRGLFCGLRLGGVYNNTDHTPMAISPEKGRFIALALELYDGFLGSDYDIFIATADLREYIRVPIPHSFFRHHVLALRLAGGIAEGDVLLQRTFRLGGSLGESYFYGRSDKYFSLRGYETSWFLGQRVLLGSAEYRFPVWKMERGLGTLPVFFRQVHGALFADCGDAFDKGFEPDRLKLGLGAELRLDVTLGYGLPLSGRLGYAWGKDEWGISTVYAELGTSF